MRIIEKLLVPFKKALLKLIHRLLLSRTFLLNIIVNMDFLSNLTRKLSDLPERENVFRVIEHTRLIRLWERLIAENTPKGSRALIKNIKKNMGQSNDPALKDKVLKSIVRGNTAMLHIGTLEFTDTEALWIQLNEIIINEEYFFETSSETPRILDCGTNLGLSILYFKSLYPEASIIGFEPVPELNRLTLKNIKANALENITILPYALSGDDGKDVFVLPGANSMAGHLAGRREALDVPAEEINLKTMRLSQYLKGPIDMLKLDIEGSEHEVLLECAGKLRNVRNLYCEYHGGQPVKKLTNILNLLESLEFEVRIGRSWSAHNTASSKPLEKTRQYQSVSIYATNKTTQTD